MSLDTTKLSNYTGQVEGDLLRDYLLSVDRDLINLSRAASVFYQFGTGNNYSVLTYTSTNYVWFPTVGAWNITSTLLFGGAGSTYIGLQPGTGIWLGDEAFANAPFSVDPTGVLKAHSGEIGGWSIGATILSSTNITLDSANSKINIGSTIDLDGVNEKIVIGSTITIDGVNEWLESNDYISGVAGRGWRISESTAEFGDIRARGKITCAVFEKETLSSVGGNLLVMDSDILAATMSTADNATLTIIGTSIFDTGDFLRIKDNLDDEWMEITGSTSAYTYTLTRDKKGDYGANANPGWEQGVAVVNYGVSGEGGILLTSSEPYSPYIDFFTHAGSPWSAAVTKTRIGNLNGIAGASGFGIFAGAGFLGELDVIDLISIGTSGAIRSNTTGNFPYLEFSNDGLQLKDSDAGGTYGTAAYSTTGTYGAGALVWILNTSLGVPWVEIKEPSLGGSTIPSFRFFNRAANPTGASILGDICVSGDLLKRCVTAGTPGTYLEIGAQKDDADLTFGTDLDAKLKWETADVNANELLLVLPDGDGTNVPVFVIGNTNIDNVDLAKFAGETDPTVALFSADATKRVTLKHNGTNAQLYSSSGDIILFPVGNNVRPNADNDVSFGSTSYYWKDIRFKGNMYTSAGAGVTGTFTAGSSEIVGVTDGIITSIV